jgi:hypothetical protein
MSSNYFQDAIDAIRAELSETDLPADGGESLLAAYALVLRLRGTAATDEDIHDAWAAWRTCRGDEHTDLVPFRALDEATQHKDRKYAEAVRRAAQALR